jgi:hypothetical protein
MKRLIASTLIVIMVLMLFPAEVRAFTLNDAISVDKRPVDLIKDRSKAKKIAYSGQWDVKVRNSDVAEGIGVKALLNNKDAPNYIFIPQNSVDRYLVNDLGGNWDFVSGRYKNLLTNVGGQDTIYITFLAHLCGADPGRWQAYSGGGGYQEIIPTPPPSVSISSPSSVKAGESVRIGVRATTFVRFSHPDFTPATGLFADRIKVTVEIDGRQVHYDNVRQRNYTKTITHTFDEAGRYTIRVTAEDVVGRETTTTKTINVTSAPVPPPPPGSISANISMSLSPNSIKKGKTADVKVSLDASNSRSSGSGPFHYRWWVKKNGRYITSKDGVNTKENSYYDITESKVSPGDTFWAKVKVYDFSINKADDAETERSVFEEGEEPPDPEPIPEPPEPPSPPIPVPPVADFDMPEKRSAGSGVKIVNRSKNNNGFTRYDGYWLDCEWIISPSDGVDTERLEQKGGKVVFNKDGVYDVTLTITDNKGMSDTTSKQIEITNSPPWIKIQAPDEVLQGIEIFVSSDYDDPDMNIDLNSFKWTITPIEGRSIDEPLEDGNIDSFNCLFDNVGEYEIKVTIKDTCGLTATDTHKVKVLPILPEAYFTFEGSQKQNRKIVFDSSGSSSAERYPVDWSKNEWDFIPQTEGITEDDIKIVESEDVKTRTVMFKKPGDYKIRLRVENEAGNKSEWYEQLLRIYEDEPPIADFYVQSTVLRDPVNSNKAKIELIDSSYSPDADIISERIWRYKYDSNNDGNFEDEVWQVLDNENNTNPVLYTDQVGKYLFELYVKEEFGEETIPEFLTPEDVRDADTAEKAIEDKKCEVVNLQPVVDFEAITKPKVDLVVKGVTNSSWANRFNSEANTLASNISGKGFSVKRDVKLEQRRTGTRSEQKGYIYFYCWGRPYSRGKWTATNYDIDNHEGDFGRVLRYSYSTGYNNFDSLKITVNHTERVPEDQYYPDEKPRLEYSSDGRNWKNVSLSFNGYYSTWSYTESGEYSSREFGFDSDYIRDDIRYIRVRDSHNSASQDIVGVDATAYGNEEYTIYANLNDSKLTQELNRPWQEDSSKYVVLVSDCGNSISKVYDIVNDYILKGIKVVFVGTSGLRTVGNQIAEGTGGTFIEFDGRNVPWDRIEEYLTDELQKQKTITQTILVGEEVEYKIYYNDPENDPKYQERWLYTHDHKYYENSLGLASFSDKYIDTAVTRFDKVGKYEVTYQARDNPKDDNEFDEYRLWSYMPLSKLEIYVHRKPIAQFTATIKPNGSKFDITISSTSYDLDHYSETSRGIIEEEWKWKDYNSTTWNSGKPNSIDSNKKILVSLRVKDKEGVWSDPYIKVLSTAAENLPPIAQFTATPSTQIENKSITIADQSYDPNGDPIAEWRWRVKKPNGSWVNYRGRMPTDITKLGVGIYTIELKVRDKPRVGSSLWSEPYTQTVKVIADNNKPVARFTIGPNPIIADEGYILNDTSYDPDGDPIVAREWKIQRPNGTWVNIPELKPTFEEMGIDDDGTYRIGLRVLDDPTRRNPILSPYWSDWYYQTVTVESPLNVIGDSDKDVYRAGQAMLLSAETEGKAYRVEARMWYPKNEYSSTNVTTLVPDTTLTDPPQKFMTWHSRRTKEEGRDIVVIIPLNTPDGTYPVTFTAFKRKYDGGTKTATHTVYVKVQGTIYDGSKSQIIGR